MSLRDEALTARVEALESEVQSLEASVKEGNGRLASLEADLCKIEGQIAEQSCQGAESSDEPSRTSVLTVPGKEYFLMLFSAGLTVVSFGLAGPLTLFLASRVGRSLAPDRTPAVACLSTKVCTFVGVLGTVGLVFCVILALLPPNSWG